MVAGIFLDVRSALVLVTSRFRRVIENERGRSSI